MGDKKFTDDDVQKAKDEAKAAYIAQFKEQHDGLTPEQFAEREKKRTESEAARAEEDRKTAISAFGEDIKKKGLAPSIVDDRIVPFATQLLKNGEKVSFKEGDEVKEQPALEAFKSIFSDMVTLAEESKLIVPMGETEFSQGGSGKTHFDERKDVDVDALKMFKQAQARAKEKGISFEQAIMDVVTATE